METLQVIWYILIWVLLLGYSLLDGFDLGVGVLFPFLSKTEEEKRIMLNSIGPYWDGNEVWLLTGGGALFAAFPHAYATVFSGFYLALMLVLFALIFRAVSIEFRAYSENKKVWGTAFFIGSFIPALLYGVALGNVVYGVPIKEINGYFEFSGNFFTLLRPYPLLWGTTGLFMFILQGNTWIILKSEGELSEKAKAIFNKVWFVFLILFGLLTIATFILLPEVLKKPLCWIFFILALISLYLSRKFVKDGKERYAFYSTSALITSLWGIVGVMHFPNLVKSINDPQKLSLTIYNSSSSKLTLTVMLIIALLGMPIVIYYTAYLYKIFKGKIKLEEKSGY